MNGRKQDTPLPHQQRILDEFFEEPTSRGYALRWDVGLGASWTIARLIKKFLADKPISRILVLSPKAVAVETEHHLASAGVPAELVDRFRYREMQDAAPPDGSLWREGTAFVLGIEFAKQTDILSTLRTVPWSLIVVQEAHHLQGQGERLVRELVASSPEIKVLWQTTPGTEELPRLNIEHWSESKVRHTDVVDASGRRIFDLPSPIVRSIEFPRDAAEDHLRKTIAGVVQLLGATKGTSGLLSAILEQSMRSSLSALEEVLRRLRNRLTHGKFDTFQEADEQDNETDTDDLPLRFPAANQKLLDALDKGLEELDALAGDSKIKGLTKLLRDVKPNERLPRSICILTKYRATLLYIQAALEELGFVPYVLHGALPLDERSQAVQEFQEHGGILLATTAVMSEGLSMPQVESLVIYDLPRSPLMLQQILGRFQRFGRTMPLTIDVINSGESMEVLGQILSENVSDHETGNEPSRG